MPPVLPSPFVSDPTFKLYYSVVAEAYPFPTGIGSPLRFLDRLPRRSRHIQLKECRRYRQETPRVREIRREGHPRSSIRFPLV